MKKSLEELYREYELSIMKQKKTISEQQLRLKEAKQKHNLGEIARLNKLIHLLYIEKLELEGAAVGLREYFRNNLTAEPCT